MTDAKTTTSRGIPFVDLSFQHHPIQAEIDDAIATVLQRGDFVLGEAVRSFETAFAQACGAAHGVGVGCGTDAIALGLQAAGIGPGDEVILPANTFVATLIGVMRTGATPILVDCDPDTALIDLIAAERAITPNTRAIVPVHLYGQMVSPCGLLDLASTYDVLIFEDAAQAHLAEREGYRAGSVGIAAAFSFYPSKNLGAFGDGGMLVTQNPYIAQKVQSLRNYGAPRKYYHTELGTNSRLDSIQAAVLMTKLPYLDDWNCDRRRVARQYDTLLQPLTQYGVTSLKNDTNQGHVYHLYVIQVADTCRLDRDILQATLADHNIQTGIHYPLPCHLQPAFASLGYSEGAFPNAERLCQTILSLPMYPGLTSSQVQYVADVLHSLLNPSSLSLSITQSLFAS
ncbi:MAG: DegT/DnrJ/EryC1/StrS family aminotransferase [Merismopedia sp. SIO2A8]|nr:DegT/DnrJ/EryC1/StrS family aminotransferase [Merismopedia sp. SIO2A8]